MITTTQLKILFLGYKPELDSPELLMYFRAHFSVLQTVKIVYVAIS